MAATVKIIPFADPGGVAARPPARRRATSAVSVAPYRPLRDRRRLDAAAGPEAERRQQDARRSGGAARRRRARASSRSVAVPHETHALAEALRALDEPLRRADRVRRLRDHRPARRDPRGAGGGGRPHRAFRHAGRSRQPAALRRARRQARASARRAARARPRRTASTGCSAASSPACRSRRADIQAMGVGGLLMEIESRPQPRKPDELRSRRSCSPPGRASRYRAAGGAEPTKLVADYRGEPLVRWAVARGAGLARAPGDRGDGPRAGRGRGGAGRARRELRPQPRFRRRARDLAARRASPRCRRTSPAPSCCSATCRRSTAPVVDALIAAFHRDPRRGRRRCRSIAGRRGNPVLLGRELFAEVARLERRRGRARGCCRRCRRSGSPPSRSPRRA